MKRLFKHRGIIALLTTLLATSCMGFSKYIVDKSELSESITIKTDSTTRAVCYNDTTNVKYLTIEKALDQAKSGETVYVYPSLKNSDGTIYTITITRDCEIKSGVTLTLPFESTTYLKRSKITEEFADRDADNVAKNRVTQVVLNEKITITNNGSLLVGGELGIGEGNQRPTGHTAGKYSEITMYPESKIENNGSMEIYGYIKESASDNGSKIDHGGKSTTKLPFVFYDYRGGTYCSKSESNGIFPLNAFDMPNCQAYQTFASGAKVIGCATLFALNMINDANCTILSNDDNGFFVLSSGNVSIKYSPSSANFSSRYGFFTTNDCKADVTPSTANYTTIETNGDFTLNKMVVSTYDSSEYFCPIPQKFKIIVKGGEFKILYKTKFLSGSSLSICEGAKVTIKAETSFYQGYIPQITVGTNTNIYPSLGAAKFQTAGIVNIEDGGFGGLIEITGSTAQLNTSDNTKQFIPSKEQLNNSDVEWHCEYGKTYYGSTEKCVDPILLSAAGYGNFNSGGDYWVADINEPSKTIDSAAMTPNEGTSKAGDEKDYDLIASYLPEYTNCVVESFKWSCDDGGTFTVADGQSTRFTTPVNSDTANDKTYTVKCTITYSETGSTTAKAIVATGVFVAAHDTESTECFTWDTKIRLANGSYKLAKDVCCGDNVVTFDHNTGLLSQSKVAYVYYKPRHETTMLTLKFSNGNSIKIVDDGHCLFDIDKNSYVEIDRYNVFDFIGHRFYGIDDKDTVVYTLKSYAIAHSNEEAYSILTSGDINCFANNLLNVSDNIEGLYNYFDLGANMKIDRIKKASDIEKHGLAKYNEWSYWCLESEFIAFNGQYLNISIGKGLTTKERLQRMMKIYSAKSMRS